MEKNITIAFRNHSSVHYTYQQLNEKFCNTFGFNGETLLARLKEMFIDQVVPQCAKIVIDQWSGTSSYFYLTLKDNDNTEVTRMTVDRGYSKDNYKYTHIRGEYFEKAITRCIKLYHRVAFLKMCENVGIVPDGQNRVLFERFENYKTTRSHFEMEGTIYKIFDDYITANDKMRYINGTYIRFSNNKIENLYKYYVANYDGNIFLDNAASRGVIID